MSRGGTRVYFGRLPRDTRERDLERFVRGFGRIREVSIKLGYGFVVSSPSAYTAKLYEIDFPVSRDYLSAFY